MGKITKIISLVFFTGLMLGNSIRAEAASGGYREFLNDRNRPEADYSGDDREVFRIIEVIPHDACSIFPYMVDWKTEEEYNRNVPIGYEGLVYGSMNSGEIMMFEGVDSKPSKAYAKIEDGLKRDFLTNYDVSFATMYTKSNGNWWRAFDESKNKQANGYFEYVGEGKGLYYINTTAVKGKNGEKNGIDFEMQALARDGKEKAGGEYEVKDPAYYWAQDYSSQMAYPTADIKSRTGFNYDLIFKLQKNGSEGYRVYDAVAREEEETGEGNFDYFIIVKEGTEEKYEFVRYKKGNYTKRGDSYIYAGAGNGNYVVGNEEVLKGINWTSEKDVTFEYAGEGTGVYDVSFIYAGASSDSAALYESELKRVINKKGRYALTSTSKTTDEKGMAIPVYEEKQGGDYSKIILRIDFSGIDYMESPYSPNNGYATTAPYGAGVRMGISKWDYNQEVGGWVFHEMTEISEKECTKLKDVEGKSAFEQGDRIYVTKQNRMYRYYCRNSFRNNEWFKLLCYMDNPGDTSVAYSDNSNGMGFDMELTSSENLVKAKNLLTGFDNTFRIDIRQRTPGQLTKEEVENADLIYISDTGGVESVVQNWGKISSYLEQNGQQGLVPIPQGVADSESFKFEDDLSNETLLAIYDKCIYTNEVALMVGARIGTNYMQNDNRDTVVKNLGKLIFFVDLMEDAQDFAYFIEGYEESEESNFNLIHQYNEGDILGIEIWPKQMGTDKYGSYKEMYNLKREGESGIDGCFSIYHFEVPQEAGIQISWKGSEYTSNSSMGRVLESETKYYGNWYSVSNFNKDELHKVWQILHNRKNKGKIVVQITNASLTYGTERKRVIYADEFDPETFNIKYKIILRGAMVEMAPPLADTLIFFDDNQNNIYDAGEICFTNTGQQYGVEDEAHERNVRSGFEDASSVTDPKQLNPDSSMRKLVVQASDINGKTGSSDVWVVVREGFDLN